jgi:hypothetical protein
MSPVGRPMPTSIARTDAPAIRANAAMVERPCSNAPKSASVIPVGYSADLGGGGHAVIGGEHQRRGL